MIAKKSSRRNQKITDSYVLKADDTLKAKRKKNLNSLMIMNVEQIYKDTSALLEGHFKIK